MSQGKAVRRIHGFVLSIPARRKNIVNEQKRFSATDLQVG
jgi:hypothetical protein